MVLDVKGIAMLSLDSLIITFELQFRAFTEFFCVYFISLSKLSSVRIIRAPGSIIQIGTLYGNCVDRKVVKTDAH